ncbi:MAG: hypothetical protein RL213_1563 [Bacteroidota bacterium]|jgi:hypothetical protein
MKASILPVLFCLTTLLATGQTNDSTSILMLKRHETQLESMQKELSDIHFNLDRFQKKQGILTPILIVSLSVLAADILYGESARHRKSVLETDNANLLEENLQLIEDMSNPNLTLTQIRNLENQITSNNGLIAVNNTNIDAENGKISSSRDVGLVAGAIATVSLIFTIDNLKFLRPKKYDRTFDPYNESGWK